MGYELKNKEHHELIGLDLFEELMYKEASKYRLGKRLLGSKATREPLSGRVFPSPSHPMREYSRGIDSARGVKLPRAERFTRVRGKSQEDLRAFKEFLKK